MKLYTSRNTQSANNLGKVRPDFYI